MAAESGDLGPGDPPAGFLDPLSTTTVAETTPGRAEPRPPPFPGMSGMMGLDLVSIQARYTTVPMPDPEGLKRLQVLYPGAAEAIFGQMVKQSDHRMELEKLATGTNNTLALRGQIIGGLLGAIGLIGSFVVIIMGHDAAGTTVATGCVVTPASLFVLGKSSQQKELAAKSEARSKIAKGDPPENSEQPNIKTDHQKSTRQASRKKNPSKKT